VKGSIFLSFRSDKDLKRLLSNAGDRILRRAAPYWFDEHASPVPKDEYRRSLLQAVGDVAKCRRVLETVTPEEREVLRIVRRYGGMVSGTLLTFELLARGIARPPDPAEPGREQWERDPVCRLLGRLLLLPWQSVRSCQSGEGVPYQDPVDPIHLVLSPGLADAIEPAQPLTWQPSAPSPEPETSSAGMPEDVARDLSRVLSFFALAGLTRLTQDHTPSREVREDLLRTVSLSPGLSAALPDPHILLFEMLLRGGLLGRTPAYTACVSQKDAEAFFASPPLDQARLWTHGWLASDVWQDGIGLVRGTGIHPGKRIFRRFRVSRARQTIAWALARVAASPIEWLDIETFLSDLHAETRGRGIPLAAEAMPYSPEESEWRLRRGEWVVQVICGTLVILGLVEVGETVREDGPARSFRLTPLGRAVFGAPEVSLPSGTIAPWKLDEWARGPASFTLRNAGRLVGFPDRATRDAFLARHGGRPVGDLFVIAGAKGWRALCVHMPWVEHCPVYVHSATVDVGEDGSITAKRLDHVSRAWLDRLAVREGRGWRITEASVRAAVDAGIPPDEIERWFILATRRLSNVPKIISRALRRWAGADPTPVDTADAEILHVPSGAAFEALRRHPRLRPYILCAPAPGWIALRRGSGRTAIALLHALGFEVEEGGAGRGPT